MKFFVKNGINKKTVILVILIFNLINPNISEGYGGALFKPIFQLISGVGDLCLKGLQYMFMGDGDIMVEAPDKKTYIIEFSPGVIFSNRVPAFDVNFFNPKDDYISKQESIEIKEIDKIGGSSYTIPNDDILIEKKKLVEKYGYSSSKIEKDQLDVYEELSAWVKKIGTEGTKICEKWKYNEKTYYCVQQEIQSQVYVVNTYGVLSECSYNTPNSYQTTKFTYSLSLLEAEYKVTEGRHIPSSARTLKNTVATWYKALRAIALVGLLSVLVYIGIRILISSTGQEKAKYKKMIGDWMAAVCILFLLQYIMIFTLKITENITNALSVNIVSEDGRDNLMSDLREDLGNHDPSKIDFSITEVFIKTMMYIVLVIYTVVFTIQYLKRLLYMAFFTMIAPLIALTYPLDKIKDGQAQAFSMWVREYTFNALLQPMHLLLYYMFVASATSLVSQNPLYAVVAIGFLLPAEKFFRKMFGFEKASSAGQIGAAAGGALIMNAINKMGHRSGKQAAGKATGGEGTKATRMASSNANTIGTGGSNSTTAGGSSSGASGGSSGGGFGSARTANTHGATMGNALSGGGRSIRNGVSAVRRKYINKNTAKSVGRMARRGALGALGAATLGSAGLAAGIATGDLGKAMQYGAAGAGAGYMGANYAGDKLLSGEKNLRETFKEGAIGQDEYNNLKMDKAFYESDEFRGMLNDRELESGKKGRERTTAIRNAVQTYRDNGITDTSKIKSAMKEGLSPQEGAYAIKLAGMIGRSGWNNPKTREDFEKRYKSAIPGASGDKIWKSIESLL